MKVYENKKTCTVAVIWCDLKKKIIVQKSNVESESLLPRCRELNAINIK